MQIKGMSPQLLVANMNRSLEFYTKQLGFAIGFLHDDFYAGITKDGYSIHLKLGCPSIEERQNRKDQQHLDLYFSIEEIDEAYKDVMARPVEITQPLRDMPYGREFYIADPDGYILGFLEDAK